MGRKRKGKKSSEEKRGEKQERVKRKGNKIREEKPIDLKGERRVKGE